MCAFRQISTRKNVRLEQHGVLISKVLFQPGPTHSLVDLLAGVVAALSPGPQTALLGFAGGGLLAPLRAMGVTDPVEAVDISRQGYGLFQQHCSTWCGPVHWEQAEALTWLRERQRSYDVILEDLSLPLNGEVVKPGLIWSSLPAWIHRRLTQGGLAAFNLLRPVGVPWGLAIGQVARWFRFALVLLLRDFENRIVVASDAPLPARSVSRRLGEPLRQIGSSMAGRFQVRTFKGDALHRNNGRIWRS